MFGGRVRVKRVRPGGAYYDIGGMDYATGRTDYGWTPGRPCSWVDAYHHINFDKVRSNSTYQQEFNSWLTDSSIPSVSLLTEFNKGVVGGRNAAPKGQMNHFVRKTFFF